MKRLLAILPLIVLAALAVLFAAYALRHDPKVEPAALVGKPLPDVTLPTLEDGRPVRLRELAGGRPMVVNFFASWCAPCEVEAPHLNALAAQGVRIVGVAYKDKPEKTRAFLARLGDPFAARLADGDGRAGIEVGHDAQALAARKAAASARRRQSSPRMRTSHSAPKPVR